MIVLCFALRGQSYFPLFWGGTVFRRDRDFFQVAHSVIDHPLGCARYGFP